MILYTSGMRYGILGFGQLTGVALLRYLKNQNITITIYDAAPLGEVQKRIGTDLPPGVDLRSDQLSEWGSDVDLLLLSPGVPMNHPIVLRALADGVSVQSELEFASSKLKCPMIAITGSMGKSTVSKMIYDLMLHKYNRVFLGGNYGVPLIEAVGKGYDLAVVEVSSFQLEQSTTFHPQVALLLNIFDNHLDRHHTFENYQHAKLKIFAHQSPRNHALILDQLVGKLDIKTKSKITKISPKSAGHHGSQHVPEHVAFLSGMADVFGLKQVHIEHVLDRFDALEHRREVFEVNGWNLMNDSKSTTPDATRFALKSLAQNLHLILGGRNKDISIKAFARDLSQMTQIQSIALIGDMGPVLRGELTHANVMMSMTLKQALLDIKAVAVKGEVILLSPGFASFDQYENMAARGRAFKKLARDILG